MKKIGKSKALVHAKSRRKTKALFKVKIKTLKDKKRICF